MTRERLPERRMTQMFTFRHNGKTAHASIGYYDDGRPGEIFLNVGTVGLLGQFLDMFAKGEQG